MTVTYPLYSEGFLLDEDKALRRHLMGMFVSDDAARKRPVRVGFAHPDNEIREQRYPYIIISLIDVTRADNRLSSGNMDLASVPLDWLSENYNIVVGEGPDGKAHAYNGDGLWTDVWMDVYGTPLRFVGPAPIPVQIDYQVRAFSRHPRHNRAILAQLLGRKVPYTYGSLDMSDVDGTVRRIELLDISHGETIEDKKRLFVSVFTVRVDSWMPVDDGTIDVIEDQFVTHVYLNETPTIDAVTDIVATDPTEHLQLDVDGWSAYDAVTHYQLPQHQGAS